MAVDTELAELQARSQSPHLPTQLTYELRKGVAGEGPRAYDWSDKPHRLVYDACMEIERLAALRRVAEPVDRVERVARALFAHDEDGNSPVKMRCGYEQLLTHQRHAYEAKARAAIAALEDTRDGN